jgi:uncharacterized membrane protein YcaP (DUF421 family)
LRGIAPGCNHHVSLIPDHQPRLPLSVIEAASMPDWFFGGWEVIARTIIVGVLAYVALILVLRVSGKRTLSKMNAFDLIVTVALGSTLAAILTAPDTALAEGVVALALLVGLQYVVTWSSVRSTRVRRLVKSAPTALLVDGNLDEAAMHRERVFTSEIDAALRIAGASSREDVALVVLETDGSFSVIQRRDGDAGTFRWVRGVRPDEEGRTPGSGSPWEEDRTADTLGEDVR